MAAADTLERIAAKLVLSEIPLSAFVEHPAIPYEDDAVTRLILDELNQPVYQSVKTGRCRSCASMCCART